MMDVLIFLFKWFVVSLIGGAVFVLFMKAGK